MKQSKVLLPIILLAVMSINTNGQEFYFGNDLSYVNMMEDCGSDFKEFGVSKDVYQIYSDYGNNLVRVRLWVDPDWQIDINQPEGVKEIYNDLEDVKETIQRSKAAGMQVLLDFHYSDFWADPGRQVIPSRWQSVADDTGALADSLYNYTFSVLRELDEEGLMPEMVQVGNETNPGMMTQRTLADDFDGEGGIDGGWGRQAQLFNAGISAVRDASDSAGVETKIALHYAGVGNNLEWWFENIIANGVTDFDVVGFSYYVAYHGSSISGVGSQVARLKADYPDREIIILETGYPWTDQNFDNGPNIITDVVQAYTPLSPAVQLDYMVNLTKAVMNNGGDGVVFWESAWVVTDCRTAWNQGSSHDHVAFFEPNDDNLITTGAVKWMDSTFYNPINSVQAVFKINTEGVNTNSGIYIEGSFTGDERVLMYEEEENLFSYVTYLSPQETGYYRFYNGDSDFGATETVPDECATDGYRTFSMGEANESFEYMWSSCDTIYVDQRAEVEVTFALDASALSASQMYITGDFTEDAGGNWQILAMDSEGNGIWSHTTTMLEDDEGGYYFMKGRDWVPDRESVPSECVEYYNDDRGYFIGSRDTTYSWVWSSCETFEYGETSSESIDEIPTSVTLNQNYPNPFNPSTIISFELENAQFVELNVYNMLGQNVRTLVSEVRTAGEHRIEFDAGNLPSGVYIYQLKAGEIIQNRKLILAK